MSMDNHDSALATWDRIVDATDPSSIRSLHEILANDVDSIEFEFFTPSAEEQEWVSEWPNSPKQIPPLIRLRLTYTDSTSRLYAFQLPGKKHLIVLDGGEL